MIYHDYGDSDDDDDDHSDDDCTLYNVQAELDKRESQWAQAVETLKLRSCEEQVNHFFCPFFCFFFSFKWGACCFIQL